MLYVAIDTHIKQVHVKFAKCFKAFLSKHSPLELFYTFYTLAYLKLTHGVSYHSPCALGTVFISGKDPVLDLR